MRTRDERFLHAVLARGQRDADATQELRDAIARLDAPFHGVDVREWRHGTQAGLRLAAATTPRTDTSPALMLAACWGGTLPRVELTAGLVLVLPDVDIERVHPRADDAPLTGQVYTPETSQAHRGTVQLGFAEHQAEGAQSFGIVKLRAKVLYATHGRHVLRFSGEMPTGWPESGIKERAITGRTAPEGSIELAVPILTPTLMHTETFDVRRLERVVATLAALAE